MIDTLITLGKIAGVLALFLVACSAFPSQEK